MRDVVEAVSEKNGLALHAGNSRWVTAMDWSGQMEYAKAPWRVFEVDGKEAGLVTGYQNVNFVKVCYDFSGKILFERFSKNR